MMFSNDLYKNHKWQTNVFIPDDKLNVLCCGPKFDPADEWGFETAVRNIQRKYGIKISRSFWNDMEDATFGQFIDRFISLGNLK